MSADLKYLAFTAILTASRWIPYIACQVIASAIPGDAIRASMDRMRA